MSADELAAAVAELGALPMPVPVVPEPLSAERLAEIAALAEAATDGPWCTDAWEIYQGTEYVPGISFWIGETCRGTSELGQDRADAAFVAAARSDVPELVAEVRRQAARIAELEAERHSTNEALDDAVQALRTRQGDGCSCPPADRPHQVGCPLDGVPGGGDIEFAVQYPDGQTVMAETISCERGKAEASLRAHRELDPMWNGCRIVQRSLGWGEWVEAPADAVTVVFSPVASLREPDGEFYGLVHHDYRVSHDLPETGGLQ